MRDGKLEVWRLGYGPTLRGYHKVHKEPRRNTKTARMGKPQIPTNTEDTEKTEGHRGGRRTSARRTLQGSLEEHRRLKPEPPPLAAMKPDAARLLPCRPKGPNLPRLSPQRTTKTHKEGNTGGGPCVRARRTSGPESEERGGLRTPRFGSWCARGAHDLAPGDAGDSGDTGAPLRGVKQTVLQSGVSRRPRGPICPIGPTASLKCVSRKRQKHKGWARQRGPQDQAATLRFPISPCRRKAPNLPRLSAGRSDRAPAPS